MKPSRTQQTTDPNPAPAPVPGQRDMALVRHELRTPIDHILTYCEAFQEHPATPRSFRDELRRIHAAGRRLLSLITEYFDDENLAVQKPDLRQLGHDLRTPVNHIVGYAEMLIEEAESHNQPWLLPDLQRIANEARQWLALMEKHLLRMKAESPASPAALRTIVATPLATCAGQNTPQGTRVGGG